MHILHKALTFLVVTAVTAIGAVLLIKAFQHKSLADLGEMAGKGIDEKLKESVTALNNASERVQTVFEHLKVRE